MARQDIVIKPADKGSSVVITNTSDYIAEAERQLNDLSFYSPLLFDPTSTYNEEIMKQILGLQHRGEISEKCYHYLSNKDPEPGAFYLLPKIHKETRPPPGRPIISAIGSPTEKISEFLDFFLQPFPVTIPSYIKDTTHFLTMVNEIQTVPPGCLLATLDVVSLYTNIPLEDARRAVARALSRIRPRACNPSNQSLIRLLDLVFQKNVFTFCDQKTVKYYVQNSGVSMGSKCSPAVACTFILLTFVFLLKILQKDNEQGHLCSYWI